MPLAGQPSSLGKFASRVEFDVGEFERTLKEHGYDAVWSKAAFCPNREKDQDDHHRINCELCDTHGFVYFDPKSIRVLVTSFGTKQLFMPESRYEPGTAYFTTLPEHKLSFWDKMELQVAQARYSEVIKLSRLLTYKLHYKAIDIAYVVTSKGKAVTDSATVDEDGSLVLDELPTGDFISVTYTYHPVYLMIDLLHQVRSSRVTKSVEDKEVELPSQAVGRLDFLVRQEGE